MSTMRGSIRHKRGTASQWAAINPVLRLAEIGLLVDEAGKTLGMKIGDGVSDWSDLEYFHEVDGDSGFDNDATKLEFSSESDYNVYAEGNPAAVFGPYALFGLTDAEQKAAIFGDPVLMAQLEADSMAWKETLDPDIPREQLGELASKWISEWYASHGLVRSYASLLASLKKAIPPLPDHPTWHGFHQDLQGSIDGSVMAARTAGNVVMFGASVEWDAVETVLRLDMYPNGETRAIPPEIWPVGDFGRPILIPGYEPYVVEGDNVIETGTPRQMLLYGISPDDFTLGLYLASVDKQPIGRWKGNGSYIASNQVLPT